MEPSEQRRIVEALVVAAVEPISATRLAQIVPGCSLASAKELINSLNAEYLENDRAFEIWEVAGGYQIRTRAEFSGYLQQLQKQRPLRLSGAALETLAVVAFKQPATRGEIEEVRGVDSGAVLKGLMERRLVRISGHRDVPGRPILYATTRRFLEVFGLESLKHLPSLRELEELAVERELSRDEDGNLFDEDDLAVSDEAAAAADAVDEATAVDAVDEAAAVDAVNEADDDVAAAPTSAEDGPRDGAGG
jgi:segregation and condensation protein B